MFLDGEEDDRRQSQAGVVGHTSRLIIFRLRRYDALQKIWE